MCCSVKPDRVVYQITPAGRTELARWLGEPSQRSGGFRDDFFLKVTAAARSGSAEVTRTLLTNQRGYLLRELRNIDGLRRRVTDPVVGLLLAAASRHVEADLAFVDDVEATLLADGGRILAELARRPSAAGSVAVPVSGAKPTRAAG